ncbi:MAG: urtE [Actinomycetia bacterium]|nr:urtE [Actinomycetes bacterium]
MLTIDRLSTGYGQMRAVHDLSLTVEPGRVTALLGHNGAGKSTAVEAIAGLLPAWSGTITLDGDDLTGVPPYRRARRGLATVLGGKRVFGHLTVEQNLLVPAARAGVAGPEWAELARDLFPVLDAHSKRRAGSLSGGQQQMLLIAQALQLRPSVLVLDEPSAGLAPAVTQVLFTALRRLADEGLAVLLVEQLVDQALRISDSATVLNLGTTTGHWSDARPAAEEIRTRLALAPGAVPSPPGPGDPCGL